MWKTSATPEPIIRKRSADRRASEKSPMIVPRSLSIGASTMRPGFGMRAASSRSSHASAPGPEMSYFPKPEISMMPTWLRTARHSSRTTGKALERR